MADVDEAREAASGQEQRSPKVYGGVGPKAGELFAARPSPFLFLKPKTPTCGGIQYQRLVQLGPQRPSKRLRLSPSQKLLGAPSG